MRRHEDHGRFGIGYVTSQQAVWIAIRPSGMLIWRCHEGRAIYSQCWLLPNPVARSSGRTLREGDTPLTDPNRGGSRDFL
jgi:hypothetical protein